MNNETDRLSAAFEKFVAERRDHRDGLTARQQLWTAFKAGAEFALAEFKKSLESV